MNDNPIREKNMAIVRAFTDAVNAWDFRKMQELTTEDFVFEMPFAPPGFEKRYAGRDTFLAFARTCAANMEEENWHDIKLDTLHSDPDEIIMTYKSDMEIKPHMRPYKNTYISRQTIRDGKLTYFAEYYDSIIFLKSLGGKVEPAGFELKAS